MQAHLEMRCEYAWKIPKHNSAIAIKDNLGLIPQRTFRDRGQCFVVFCPPELNDGL